MASIIYEGVGGGGSLFTGMKFFLMQRLPTRDRWKELVKANGGEVVLLERQADIIIADHARKNNPPGSISWKFIERSVANGALEDRENWPAGPPPGTIREVGSAQPAKQGRTPFTAEDDRILMEWCMIAERKGLPLGGNEVYKQLEAKNNRHTFQSWRDHWIKDLSHRPRPTLPDVDEDEDVESPKDDGPKLRPPQRRTEMPRTSAVRSHVPANPLINRKAPASPSTSRPPQSRGVDERKSVQKSQRTPSSAAKPTAGRHFTEEDTDLLDNSYEDILNLAEDQIIDAWITWSENYPQHTAQEWRNYFEEYVAPRRRAAISARTISPPPPKRTQANPAASSSKKVLVKAREINDSQDSPGQMTQSSRVERGESDLTLTDEQSFRNDVLALAAALQLEVDFTPEICGRKVPLFKLWQVVQSFDFGGSDRVTGLKLWPKVAKFLSFRDSQQFTAAEDLRICFAEILADLEDYREMQREQSLTESQEKAMLDAQLLETTGRETQSLYDAEDEEVGEILEGEEDGELVEENDDEELVEEDEDDDLDRLQFSPLPLLPSPSRKRSFSADRTNVDSSYKKRQRIDKGKGKELEIPSTPEDVINSTPVPRSLHKPSPLKYSVPAEHQDDEASSKIEDLLAKSFKPQVKTIQRQTLEPETQDFNYPHTQADDDPFVDIGSSPPQRKLPDRSSGSNAANRGSESNPPGSSTQSQTESEKALALERYMDECISYGYTQEAVALALDATTMEIGQHAMQVMEALENGQEIPNGVPGVWTEEDDAKVEGNMDSDGFKELVRKHGLKRCGVRKQYLKDQRAIREAWEKGEGGGD